MPEQMTEVEFRTIKLPKGLFVVLWEQPVDGRSMLAIIPQADAQACVDAIQDGRAPGILPQIVEERAGVLYPVAKADADRCLDLFIKP